MKNLFLIITLMASSAMAEVKAPGTYVPTYCTSHGVRICLGRRVSMPGQYLSLHDGSVRSLFKVVQKIPRNGGINPAYTAEELLLVDSRSAKASAHVTYLNSQPRAVSLSYKGRTYSGSVFAPAIITQ